MGHPVPHLGLPQLRGTRGVRAVVPSLSRRLLPSPCLPSVFLPSVFLPSPRPQDSQSCDAALRDFVPGQFPAIVAVQRASRSSQKLMAAMCSLLGWRLAGEEFPDARRLRRRGAGAARAVPQELPWVAAAAPLLFSLRSQERRYFCSPKKASPALAAARLSDPCSSSCLAVFQLSVVFSAL